MKNLNLKLKNQLALFNAISKIVLVLILIIIIPGIVNKVNLRDTDNRLLDKFDQVIELIDSMGIDVYIDQEAELRAFGSYNILKEEFISIEEFYQDTLFTLIESSQRMIDEDIVEFRVLSGTISIGDDYYLIEIGKSIEAVLEFERNLRNFTFYTLLILIILTSIIDLSFIQYLLSPLDKIIKKLKATQHPTTFDYTRIKSPNTDFNYLQDTIYTLMHRIEKAFNSEREYIGNVSHELLTPISIIQTKLDNLINESSLSDDELLKIIESKKTLIRLTQMVRTFLLMSRIENEEYILNEDVNIPQTLKEVLDEVEDRISARELALKIEISQTDLYIKGNHNLLFTMFFNIVNNAIKFSDPNGKIEVMAGYTNSHYVVKIKDNGHGIPKESLSNIFDRFAKSKSSREGFGLGLALVKKICDYHQIEILVESEQESWTEFTLLFK